MVPILSRHILLRVLTATAVVLIALVLIGWFTQVVTLLDFVVINRRSLVEFIGVTILLVPLIVAMIMPTALFVATIFVLDRMNSDSELAVMSAAGVSRWRILRPFLVACAAAVTVSLFANLVLQPMAMTTLRQKKAEIRADLMTTLINEGQFSAPRSGLVMHVKGKGAGGSLTGIIFQDTRIADQPVAYLAREARLVESTDEVFLLLADGSVIRSHQDRPSVDLVHFEQYTLNLSSLFEKFGTTKPRPSDMYLTELFAAASDLKDASFTRSALRAEAHNRLSNPLYSLIAMLIAFAALCEPRTTRRSRVWSILAAIVIASVFRVGGIILVSAAERSEIFVVALYALPLLASAGTLAYMAMRDGGAASRTAPLPAAGGDRGGFLVGST